MITVTPETVEAPAAGVTPWVLLVVTNQRKRDAVRKAWEDAGFAVELASDARDALECLNVMTPWVVVIDGKLYRPAPR